jgi:hypothetical protein
MPSASRNDALFLRRVRAPLPDGLAAPGLEVCVTEDRALAYVYSRAAAEGFERLEPVQDLAGRPLGRAAWRYVVETDAAEGWQDELERWYAEEHLGMLAAVPGCLRARRFHNLDAGPRSHACYELTSPQVLKTKEWLAVRDTPWSGRIRPQFRNTLRTIFRIGV